MCVHLFIRTVRMYDVECRCMCCRWFVEVRGQLYGDGSPFHLYLGLTKVVKLALQAPLTSKPWHWPLASVFT